MTNRPDTAAAAPALAGELGETEAWYAARARADNTRRGYRAALADFAAWCTAEGLDPLPAAPTTVARYLTTLAGAGAKVSTMSSRLSAITHAHRYARLLSPCDDPMVQLVWEGIRREHRSPADQAPPLMPPELWDVLDALPATPAGKRDAALILVGFVGALRRSEISAAAVEDLADHDRGLVLTIPTSKTDQHGAGQLVVLPHSSRPSRCPVAALRSWLDTAAIDAGPIFRTVHRSGTVSARAMSPNAINEAVQRACARALGEGHGYSAHSLRAGFATYAAARGAADRAIAHQTRHRSLAALGQYIRHSTAWVDNAATALDL